MAVSYTDPKQSLNFLLDPNAPLVETDERAAAAALGSGTAGSGFAANNRLRLRDSERIARLKTGQQLLQPYLDREQQSAIEAGRMNLEQQKLAAQASQFAIEQSGIDRRLSQTQQFELNQALLRGDQQAAHDLLVEAGADRRQAGQLAAQLQHDKLSAQTQLLTSLLPYAFQKGGGGSGAAVTRGGIMPGENYSEIIPTDVRGNYTPPTRGPDWGAPGRGGGIEGSPAIANLGTTLDTLLRNYGIM